VSRGQAFADNLRGAGYMVVCGAGFATNDAMMKLVAGEVPLYQAMFLRGLLVTALLFGLAAATGALDHRPAPRDRTHLWRRSIGEVGGGFLFLTALFNMPIANASAIMQSLPLAITLAAAVFWHEPVGWRRYFAIAAGFAGVLIVVRPGSDGFTVYGLFVLGAVGFITLRDLATRQLSPDVPSLLAALVPAALTTLAAGFASTWQGWAPVDAGHLAALAASGLFLITGYYFGILAMRVGEIGFIAPFRYLLLIFSILLGWAIFGEVPDRWMIVGASVIVGSGLYTFYRERKLALAG
jgi:drug/metabolite transporter (DMT)-like permease